MKTDLRRLFNHWIPPRPAERWGCDICEGPFCLISLSLEGSEWGCCHASECPRIADPVAVALLAKVLIWLEVALDIRHSVEPNPFTLWLETGKKQALRDQCDREEERADRAEQSRDELTALMVHAKDVARNAAPILRLHRQLVAAAKAGDDKAVNRIVAELGLIESLL